jgi:hypothetical protein
MHYLIVSEGDREYVLRRGRRQELEALAKQLRAEKLFRYVRVDRKAPPGAGRHPPSGGQVPGQNDAGAAPA